MSRASSAPGSQSMSGPASSQKPDLIVKCGCGLDAARLISRTKLNPDRRFYKCPNANRGEETVQCGYFAWEDQITASSSQASVPQTPSSSQSYSQSSSQTGTPVNNSYAFNSPAKPAWTNQTPSRLSSASNRSKRKRSPSPPPVPHTPVSLPKSGSGIPSVERRTLIFAGLSSPSASRDGRGEPLAKRAKVDSASEAFSDDDALWRGITTTSIDMLISSAQKPSSLGKRPATFDEDGADDHENMQDEVARRHDFTRMRADTSGADPVLDDDPSNPFIVSTPSTVTSGLPAPASLQDGSSTSTTPLSVIFQLESFLGARLPELKRQIRTSVEAKDKRITDLEKALAKKKRKIRALRDKVAKLQRGA